MPASLDTNCLLRWLLMDVPEQTLAIQRLIDTGKPYQVFDQAFIEMIFVLEKVQELSRPVIGQALQAIFAEPNIRCNRELFELALQDYLHYQKLSFMDCYLAAKAQLTQNTPLLTFDKALAKKLPLQASLIPNDNLAYS